MTLLFADGFEGYTGGGDRSVLDPVYDYNATINTTEAGVLTTGRVSGKCVFFKEASASQSIFMFGHELDVSTLSIDTTWIVGYAFTIPDPAFAPQNETQSPTMQFLDSAGDAMVTVYIAGGNINVVTGQINSTTKIGLATARLFTNVWHYLEIKITFNVTSGAVVLKIDEQQVLSASGVTAPTASGELKPTVIKLGDGSTGKMTLMDDLYICDSLGSLNNDFLGDIGIRRLDSATDGTTNEFTSTEGNNFSAVNQDDPDGDSTYVESSTVGHNDLYTIDAVSGTPATINALQVVSTGKSDDGNPKGGRNMILSNSVEGLGPTYALTSTYVPYQSIHETDPNGGAAWTVGGVDAAEIGVEVVS